MTAAELGPGDRLPAARSREELRLAQVASGLLLLLDAYRLTGRLPLEVQVQTSRLRHAVKVVIQAEAARFPTAAPVPAA
jgi:predicted GIY-YIG superfamily endonuclease